MKMRTLGKTGPEVSAIGLGCMGLSQSYPPFNKENMEANQNLAAAVRAFAVQTILIAGERYSPEMMRMAGK